MEMSALGADVIWLTGMQNFGTYPPILGTIAIPKCSKKTCGVISATCGSHHEVSRRGNLQQQPHLCYGYEIRIGGGSYSKQCEATRRRDS
jgi:hypothetical protein